MEMEKALVTGGAGFIGSNLVEELVDQGVDVVVLDDLYLGSTDNLEEVEDEIEFVQGTVEDSETVEEAVEGCDTVFHLAARSSAPMHKENPAEGVRVNVEGFVNTVEAAKQEGVRKVVYASTSSMYGSVDTPHMEDKGEMPTNLYSASKMSREMYASAYSKTLDMHFTGLRFFSVYGPHEKAKGKFANVVSQFLWKIQEGESPKIFGDGTQTRDFTFVEDIVQGIVKAAEVREKTDGQYYNLGTGRETTFNEVMEELNDIMGTEVEAEHVDNPIDNYVERTQADISRAEQDLGYEPQYSFREGLEKTVEYYREHV
jgi:UDP-glucose 4-epimerase